MVIVHGAPTLHVADHVEVEHKLKPGRVNVLHHQIWGQIAMVLIQNGGIVTNSHVPQVSSFFGKLQGWVTESGVICPFLYTTSRLKRVNNAKLWSLHGI